MSRWPFYVARRPESLINRRRLARARATSRLRSQGGPGIGALGVSIAGIVALVRERFAVPVGLACADLHRNHGAQGRGNDAGCGISPPGSFRVGARLHWRRADSYGLTHAAYRDAGRDRGGSGHGGLAATSQRRRTGATRRARNRSGVPRVLGGDVRAAARPARVRPEDRLAPAALPLDCGRSRAGAAYDGPDLANARVLLGPRALHTGAGHAAS